MDVIRQDQVPAQVQMYMLMVLLFIDKVIHGHRIAAAIHVMVVHYLLAQGQCM
jgi:hypothetical protein